MNFDPNHHEKLVWKVLIKRLNEEFQVQEIKVLHKTHVWGFAIDGEKVIEFDTTWGDRLKC